MRKIVLCFFLLAAFVIIYATPAKAQYPVVGFLNQHEIIALYRDGQYDIVKAKLVNQGFRVTKSEPDYTLNGLTHSGTFTMRFEEDSPSATMRQYGMKQISEWDFKTEKQNGFLIHEISTELYNASIMKSTDVLYNDYLRTYQNSPAYRESSFCDREEKCFLVQGDVGGAPNGFIDNIDFHFSHAAYPYESSQGSKSQYYCFKGSYRYARRKAVPQALSKPAVRQAPNSAKKKQ